MSRRYRRRRGRHQRGDHYLLPVDEYETELIAQATRLYVADRNGDDE